MKVVVEKLDNLGQGITYINDKVIFIKNVLPKEEVDIKIVADKKKYQKAEVIKIITKSNERQDNICPYHKNCGGCNLGHLKYESALKYKSEKLKEIIFKNTNELVNPIIIESDKQYNYRNKITLKIENYNWGYYSLESHNFIPINKCLLAKEAINNIIEKQNLLKIKNGEIVIRCNDKDEILLHIKTQDKYNININEIDKLNVIGIVVNDKLIYGQNYFYHEINSIKYKISYNSFFQINDYICSQIFNILNEQNLGENLLDLYCGVGTLGLSVCNNIKRLYGIEIIENAIIDAKLNAKENNINNATYFVGKVEDNVKNIKNKIDTIIVDPPRKGLNNVEEILTFNANNIIYISCDPITLGRDLKLLTQYYNIEKTYMLDMFPNTYHNESLVILKQK